MADDRPPRSEPEGLAARRAALELLQAAARRRGGMDEALTAPGFDGLDGRDRGFARALAMAALRRRGPIDRALQAKLNRVPPDEVMDLLRIGAAQLQAMDVPAHAAISTTVELAARSRTARPFKGLVNAVLRGLQREPPANLGPEALAPDWLYARWRSAYGEEAAAAMAALIAEEPAADLTPRDPADAASLAQELDAELLAGGSLRTRRHGDVSEWPGFAEGRWWVQDASSAVPARLLAPRPGETILDLCAAPGGKALQLAAAGAKVTAVDRSAGRLRRLSENLARIGLAAEVVVADAGAWDDGRVFDAVLLDAPCTATGTFRRHPDVLWATRPGDISKLAALQAQLLAASADRVRPGGRLVYCVCSLEPEEGEAQVRGFLQARPDFLIGPAAAGEGGAPAQSVGAEGWLRILPHHLAGGTDGFFAARLERLPGLAGDVTSEA